MMYKTTEEFKENLEQISRSNDPINLLFREWREQLEIRQAQFETLFTRQNTTDPQGPENWMAQAYQWLEKAEAIYHRAEQEKPVLRPPHSHEHHGHDGGESSAALETIKNGFSFLGRFKGDVDEAVHVLGLLVTTVIKLARSGPDELEKEFLTSALQLATDATAWMRDQILPASKMEAGLGVGLDALVIGFAAVAVHAGIHELKEMIHDRPILAERVRELKAMSQSLEELEKSYRPGLRLENQLPPGAEALLRMQRIRKKEDLNNAEFAQSQNRWHGMVGAMTLAAGVGIGVKAGLDLGAKAAGLGGNSEGLMLYGTVVGAATTLGVSPVTAAAVLGLGMVAYPKIKEQLQKHREGIASENEEQSGMEVVDREIAKQEDFFKSYKRGMAAFTVGGTLYFAFSLLPAGEVISSYLGKSEWLKNISTIPVQDGGLIAGVGPMLWGSWCFFKGHPVQDQYQQDFQKESSENRFLTNLHLLPKFNPAVDPAIAHQMMKQFVEQNEQRETLRRDFVENKTLLIGLMRDHNLEGLRRDEILEVVKLMEAMHEPLADWREKQARTRLFDYYGPLCQVAENSSEEQRGMEVTEEERHFAKIISTQLAECYEELEADQMRLMQTREVRQGLSEIKRQLSDHEATPNEALLTRVVSQFRSLQQDKVYQSNDPIVVDQEVFKKLANDLRSGFAKGYEERVTMMRETKLAGVRILKTAEKIMDEVANLEKEEARVRLSFERGGYMIPTTWGRNSGIDQEEASGWEIDLEGGLGRRFSESRDAIIEDVELQEIGSTRSRSGAEPDVDTNLGESSAERRNSSIEATAAQSSQRALWELARQKARSAQKMVASMKRTISIS